MSRKRRILIWLVSGLLALILVAYLSLPYVFRAVGRAQLAKLKELGAEHEALQEEEFNYEGDDRAEHFTERKKELDGRIKKCREGLVNAFSAARRINASCLNDEELVWLASARWWLAHGYPSFTSHSESDPLYLSMISELEDALRINPKNKNAYFVLFQAYANPCFWNKAKTQKVGERFKKAFPDDPDMLYALYNYGILTAQDKESEKKYLLQIIERDPSHEANFSLARLLRYELNFDEAIAVLEKWIESKPERHYIRLATQKLENVKCDKEEIEKNEAILAENPKDFLALKALAEIYDMYLLNDEHAFYYLEKAYKLNPNDKYVMDELSYYRQKFGDTEGARELYEKYHWGNEEQTSQTIN